MSAAIETHELTRRFGEFVAVDRVTFTLESGQIMGYLGPNGSGKTTTMRMLLGLLHPSSGSARVLGCDVVAEAAQVRAQTGYMSQKFALYNELTVRENLEFYAGVYGVRDRRRVAALLGELGLTGQQQQRVSNLSAGWRQRLALGVAIVHRPRLLFLDEPTSGVDPVARRAFWDLIYELAAGGITVLVSTHYMDEAEYCGRVGIMRAGHLLALDTPEALKRALPGAVWDINAEPLIAAVEAAEALPGVSRAILVGDRVRLVAERSVTGVALTAGLAAAGVQVRTLVPGEPSMEDVFMALSGG